MLSLFFAQATPAGDAIVKRMADVWEKSQNVSYVLAPSIEATQDGKSIPPPGIVPAVAISVANPGKLRLEYGNRLQVTDGNVTWIYDSSTKQYSKAAAATRLNQLGLPPLRSLLPGMPLTDLLESPGVLREEVLDTDGGRRDCWVVQHTIRIPDDLPPPAVKATISSWIDKDRSIALKHVILISISSNPPREITATIAVRNLALDAPLAADRFTFAPPPDSREVQTEVSLLNLVGTTAPRFSLRDMKGASFSLDSLKGKTVLLDFWATWCGPCRESAPVIEKLHSEFKDKGLVVLGVDVGEEQKLVEAYLKPRPAPYPIVIGSDYGLDRLFQVGPIPTFIVISGEGKIVAHQTGYSGESRLQAMVANAVLGQPDSGPGNVVTVSSAVPAIAPYSPSAVAVDRAGNLFLTDTGGRRVLKIPREGPAVAVAGNGAQSPTGDEGPAILASLKEPSAIAVDAAGVLYIADNGSKRIRKMRSDGTIASVEIADLDRIGGMAIDTSGNIFFSEPLKHRVRKIGPDGKTVAIVAGTGGIGFRGDGGPATAALLVSPTGLAVDPRGNLYIADPAAGRVRRVSTDGTISLTAGNGSSGYSGDGGLAVLAQLKEPIAVAVDAAGDLLISGADFRIRKVTPGGTIVTAFGSGTAGFAGDGGPASQAQFGLIPGLAFDSNGALYLADPSNQRVRKIDDSGVISTLPGSSANQ
jgi:thiol-disulfide isomerase/thioredoxin